MYLYFFPLLVPNFPAKESSYQDFLLGLKEISCLHARLGTQNSKMVFSGQGLIRANTSKKKNSTCQWMKAPGCFLPCLYDGVLINCHWFQGQLCGRPCWLNGNRKSNALRIWLACRWLCITNCVCVSIMTCFCYKSFPLCPLLYQILLSFSQVEIESSSEFFLFSLSLFSSSISKWTLESLITTCYQKQYKKTSF